MFRNTVLRISFRRQSSDLIEKKLALSNFVNGISFEISGGKTTHFVTGTENSPLCREVVKFFPCFSRENVLGESSSLFHYFLRRRRCRPLFPRLSNFLHAPLPFNYVLKLIRDVISAFLSLQLLKQFYFISLFVLPSRATEFPSHLSFFSRRSSKERKAGKKTLDSKRRKGLTN